MKKYLVGLLVFFGVLVTSPASAEMYALLMGVGDYQAGIPALKGVKHDVLLARSIANLLDTKTENVQVLQNSDVTLEGMRKAFDELEHRVMVGDKVFVYFSGYGGRQDVHKPTRRCAESLITVSGAEFSDAELDARLKKLSERAQKMIVFIDAAHSGSGVSTPAAGYIPKYWRKGEQDACSEPSNLVTHGLDGASHSAGNQNYVYISAARSDETSFDTADGGLVTMAWEQCMSGQGQDLDASGGLTVEEIRVCAQQKIDTKTRGLARKQTQNIRVSGNSALVMTLASASPSAANSASAAPATLLDIYNGRDSKREVEILLKQDHLGIGKDSLSFGLRSSHDGYVYIFMAGSDGQTFDLLFPNKLDRENRILSGQTLQFPRKTWEVIAQGPVGQDHILAIVADAPRDLSAFPVANAGPFSEVAANQDSKRGLQRVTSSTSIPLQTECGEARKRNLVVKPTLKLLCSDAYGAGLAKVSEVDASH